MPSFHVEHEDDERDAAGRDDVQAACRAGDARLSLHGRRPVRAHVLARRRQLERGVRAVGDGDLSAAAALAQRREVPSRRRLRDQLQEHCHQDHQRPATLAAQSSPFLEFVGNFTPGMGSIVNVTPVGTSLHRKTLYDVLFVPLVSTQLLLVQLQHASAICRFFTNK